jgi:lycopene beta-cyclase
LGFVPCLANQNQDRRLNSSSTIAPNARPSNLYDVLVIGGGPAGLALTAALAHYPLQIGVVTATPHTTPWTNTYGIWADELAPLGLTHLLAQQWAAVSVYFHGREQRLPRAYGLLDNGRLQAHLLHQTHPARARGQATWYTGLATTLHPNTDAPLQVSLDDGRTLAARLLIDASGHQPRFLQRQAPLYPVAYQAAYGITGRFSRPPVAPGQMVLMDYRPDFLTGDERRTRPPTFLYAMDLGDDRYMVEETSLAHAPAMPLDELEARLYRRLAHRGIEVTAVEHIERCLFPMNQPLPAAGQALVGYGGAASMVHPASGYQVGAALTRAPLVAAAVAAALADPALSIHAAAAHAAAAVWPADRLRRHALYTFGLQNLLDFDETALHDHFTAFFALPQWRWAGYLSNTLTTPQLLSTMLMLFGHVSGRVRRRLTTSVSRHHRLLGRALRP